MKILEWSILFSMLFVALFYQKSIAQIPDSMQTDVVFFKGGKTLKGQILDMTSKEGLLFKTNLGVKMRYPYDQIRKMVRKPALKDMMTASYGELGITYGTPGLLNFSAGYWSGKMGARITGMVYGSSFSALQIMAGVKLKDNTRYRHSMGLAYGRFSSYGEGFNYIGPVYNYTGPPFNIKRMTNAWFVEIGYAIGFEGGNESQGETVSFPLLQIGYQFRFIPQAPRNERLPIPSFPKPPPCPEPAPCPECPECQDCSEIAETVYTDKSPPGNILDLNKEADERVIAMPIKVVVKKPRVKIRIWDNGIVDRDVISLQLNGQWVLQKQMLGKEPIELDLEIEKGQENVLIMHAHNLGKRSPNTAAMTIQDEFRSQTIILRSDLKNSSSVQFMIKK